MLGRAKLNWNFSSSLRDASDLQISNSAHSYDYDPLPVGKSVNIKVILMSTGKVPM